MEILEQLFANVNRAREQLSVYYTACFAARGHKAKTVVKTDFKAKKLFFKNAES